MEEMKEIAQGEINETGSIVEIEKDPNMDGIEELIAQLKAAGFGQNNIGASTSNKEDIMSQVSKFATEETPLESQDDIIKRLSSQVGVKEGEKLVEMKMNRAQRRQQAKLDKKKLTKEKMKRR